MICPPPNNPAWTNDEEYQKDLDALAQQAGGLHVLSGSDFAQLNRFREMRLTARMTQLLLGTQEKVQQPPSVIDRIAGETRRDASEPKTL